MRSVAVAAYEARPSGTLGASARMLSISSAAESQADSSVADAVGESREAEGVSVCRASTKRRWRGIVAETVAARVARRMVEGCMVGKSHSLLRICWMNTWWSDLSSRQVKGSSKWA